ncbi:hypothetical protein BTS2_1827 [Bacillus sp. TS-2]|nr:hypothetical protein BTS2_1827 [Bacillus sp. TS-2]
MLKKVSMGLTILLLLNACQAPDSMSLQSNDHSQNMGDWFSNSNSDSSQYGYSRLQREQVHTFNGQKAIAPIDRDEISTKITQLVLSDPHIEEAATLITDQYALVVYVSQKNESNTDEQIADTVRRTAESVIPRYYEVFVADDHEMFENIERFQNLSSKNSDALGTLKDTIEKMQKYPQGMESSSTKSMNKEEEKMREIHS